MKYSRLLAAAAAVTMLFSGYSCGKDDNKASSDVNDSTVSDSAETTEKTTEKNSSKDSKSSKTDKKDGEKTTTEKKDEKSDKKTTTTKAGEKKSDTTTTAKKDSSDKGGNNSGGGSSDNNDNNNSSQGGSNNESGGSGEEVKEYTAEITLGGTPKVTGSNVKVDGGVVTITAGGDYLFTGNMDNGQIRVNTGASEDKVTVVLNGVNISNPSAPAIFIEEAKRCTIKPKEGSVNYVSSDVAKKGVQDTGAIFSNDTVRLKGNGELNVTATASHVIIESGTYNIDSRKSGIIANDDITINEGRLNIKGGTNGLKSKGTININGGYSVVSGGTKEEKSSIYAGSTFSYTGGYLYAAGNKVSVPTYSETPYIVADLGETVGAGGSVEFFLNGNSMITMNPHNDFRCVMMLAPEVSGGSSFAVSVNGNRSQDFSVSNEANQFSLK